MNNITRTALAVLTVTLLAGSASAAGYLKLGDIKGEVIDTRSTRWDDTAIMHLQYREQEESRDDSRNAGGEHEIEYDIAAGV